MRLNLYTVYDSLAQEGGPVFQAPNDQVAKRNYKAILQQVSPVDAEEYQLFMVGEYDSETLEVFGCPKTRIEYKAVQPELGGKE